MRLGLAGEVGAARCPGDKCRGARERLIEHRTKAKGPTPSREVQADASAPDSILATLCS
jgi:hypothetical protein